MGSGHIRKVSVIVALKTCISFYDTDSDTDSSITHAQANYPVQKSSSSQAKGKCFEMFCKYFEYVSSDLHQCKK